MKTAIDRMCKKQRAAHMFLRLMNDAPEPHHSSDPEKIEAFLYAFLAAARTVTIIANTSDPPLFEAWRAGLTEEDGAYVKYLIDERNAGQHRGEERFDIELKSVPYSGGIATMQGQRMPGEPGPPSLTHVQRHSYTFLIADDTVSVEDACNRYLDLVDSLVESFVNATP